MAQLLCSGAKFAIGLYAPFPSGDPHCAAHFLSAPHRALAFLRPLFLPFPIWMLAPASAMGGLGLFLENCAFFFPVFHYVTACPVRCPPVVDQLGRDHFPHRQPRAAMQYRHTHTHAVALHSGAPAMKGQLVYGALRTDGET